MPSDNNQLQAALEYAGRGWYVFPCREKPGTFTDKNGEAVTRGIKSPYTTHGKNDATIDPQIIKGWWAKYPNALIGVWCKRSGFFAVDIDNKDGRSGSRSWVQLVETYGGGNGVIVGPAQFTTNGGYHLLFKHPDATINSTNDDLASGLDLKSDGYIILAPSVLNGKQYAWLDEHGPDTALLDAPGWLLDLIQNMDKQAQTRTPQAITTTDPGAGAFWLHYYLNRAVPGQRNQTGFSLACQLRDSGISQSIAKTIMTQYANQVPGNNYSVAEALASMESAYNAPRRSPAQRLPGLAYSTTLTSNPVSTQEPGTELQRAKKMPAIDFAAMPELPDFATFDQSAGTGAGRWIDQYISYSKSVSPMTPVLFHESAALWLTSVAVARRLVLPMAYGSIYPNLYILWMANTTLYRKSTALNIARTLAGDVFPFLLAAQDTTPEAFLSDLAGIQPQNFNSLSILDQQAWEQERNFSAQRGWVLDELSGLMAGAGKDYNAGLLESLLRFYDCDPLFTRSTTSRGRTVVKSSYLAMLGASTPAAMTEHFRVERLWSNGFWPRFAIMTPEERPAWEDAAAITRPSDLENTLQRLFTRLPNGNKWPEPPQSLTVTLASEAFSHWTKYNRALSNDLLTDTLPEILWGAYGRLPTHALKIAMLLAALDWSNESPAPMIEGKHMVRALTIAETWRASAHRAIATTTVTDFNRVAERIIKVIGKFLPQGASFRDICQAMKDKRPADLQMTVIELVSAGQILETTANEGKAGRPTTRYILETD